MIRKIENALAVALVFFLAVLPLVLKLIQQGFGIPVISGDQIQLNMVFLFSCVACVVTWREDRHLSLASLSDHFPPAARSWIARVRAASITAILTALFFTAFSETFVAFTPADNVWGIPLTVIFAALPLMYLCLLFMACARSEHRISAVVGLLIGAYIAMGPITGILYSLFGWDSLSALYAINDSWLWFSSVATIPLVILAIFLALCGVPLFVIISGVTYLAFSQGGGYVEVIALESYNIVVDKSIAAIPLFTIAGYILSEGSAGRRLVEVFHSLFGWFRGGVVVAVVVVATFFTTFTGVSGVTILALGGLLTLLLSGAGYKKDDAQSLITASGAVGLLFPPSMAIIVYATTNYFSVDAIDMFKGAVVPGVLLALSMMVFGIIRDKQTDRPKFSLKVAGAALKDSVFELLLPVLIIIGYFAGFLSLMEVASFAVVYVFCLETFIRKDFTFRKALSVVVRSIPVAGGVLAILGAARGLSYFIVDANIPNMLADFVVSFVNSKYVFLLLLNLVLLLVGCFMDIYSAILIVSPLIIPIAEHFGIHPVHTGVIFLMNLQLGFLTPPVGMDLFISSYAFDTPLVKVIKGVLPYILIQFLVLMLVTYVPWFSTALI